MDKRVIVEVPILQIALSPLSGHIFALDREGHLWTVNPEHKGKAWIRLRGPEREINMDPNA